MVTRAVSAAPPGSGRNHERLSAGWHGDAAPVAARALALGDPLHTSDPRARPRAGCGGRAGAALSVVPGRGVFGAGARSRSVAAELAGASLAGEARGGSGKRRGLAARRPHL